jgi:hypothetical protein
MARRRRKRPAWAGPPEGLDAGGAEGLFYPSRRGAEERAMGRNIGGWDQMLRIGIGTALVTMWIFGPLGWWAMIGFLPLVTGFTGVCPIYPLLGISTWRAPTQP